MSPRPQMKLAGSRPTGVPDNHMPSVIFAKNTGWDGSQVIWKFESELPNYLRLDQAEVQCEGYSGPGDPEVLVGSCGVVYSLKVVGPIPDEQGPSPPPPRKKPVRKEESFPPPQKEPVRGKDALQSFAGVTLGLLLFLGFVVAGVLFIVFLVGIGTASAGYVEDGPFHDEDHPSFAPCRSRKKTGGDPNSVDKRVDSEDEDDDDYEEDANMPSTTRRAPRRRSRSGPSERTYAKKTSWRPPVVVSEHHHHDDGPGFFSGLVTGYAATKLLSSSSTPRPSTTSYTSAPPSSSTFFSSTPSSSTSSSWSGGGGGGWGSSSSRGGSSTSKTFGGTTSL